MPPCLPAMSSTIVPLAPAHFDALYAVLDEVARERRYLAMLQAPPRESTHAFFRDNLAQGHPHFVALLDGELVGWCDVLPVFGEARAHVGTLGVGLLRHARHRGLGAALMRATIDAAWAKGLRRIELTVRADNPSARALYERLGFQHEGLQRAAFRVDGLDIDMHAMALLIGDQR
jgi:ribosomal protein S18 acetylase RimI-like enzyme